MSLIQVTARGSHQAPKPLAFQIVHLEWSDCNETFRRGKAGPPESVQTIIITFYQHGEEIFANLESLQASQAVPGEGIFKLLCHPTKVKNDEIHALQSVGALFSTKKLVQEHELVLK